MQILLRSLLRVALATGRAVAWPDFPCAWNVSGALDWPLWQWEVSRSPGCGIRYRCVWGGCLTVLEGGGA